MDVLFFRIIKKNISYYLFFKCLLIIKYLKKFQSWCNYLEMFLEP